MKEGNSEGLIILKTSQKSHTKIYYYEHFLKHVHTLILKEFKGNYSIM